MKSLKNNAKVSYHIALSRAGVDDGMHGWRERRRSQDYRLSHPCLLAPCHHAGLAIMLAIFMALWRLALAYRRMLIKNRELFELIHRKQRREVRDIQRLARQTEQERTPNEQLFLRLVELMKKQQRYTDADLNRDMLAAMLGTNHRYIDDAIRECSDSPSTKAFIDGYRVDHAARLLTSTDDSIALIAEMSGFANRTTFNEQFRSRYKMTPSEYRRASKS